MIEFKILARGLFRADQVMISYDPSLRLRISSERQEWVDQLWQQKLRDAKARGTRLFDGPLFRFIEASVQDDTLHILLSDTSYKEYVATRGSEWAMARAAGASDLSPDRIVTRFEAIAQFIAPCGRLEERGNPLSVCSVVETSDDYILIDRRQGMDIYNGCYHVIGGYCARNLDMSAEYAKPDPFAAMRREIREETGIQECDISAQYSLGLIYDLATPHTEMCFLTRLNIPLTEAQARQPEDDEIQELHTLQVTAESLRTFILQHHGQISSTGEANLLLYGSWKFGNAWHEEIMEAIS